MSLKIVHWQIILIFIKNIVNPTSSAVLSSETYVPSKSQSTYFSVLFYSRSKAVRAEPYPELKLYCAGALISPKWVITNMNCHVKLSWKILLGQPTVPKFGIHKTKTYNVMRIIDSLDSILTMVEMERKLNDFATKIPKIRKFSSKSNCIVAAWMAKDFDERQATRKLHCKFEVTHYTGCKQLANNLSIQLRKSDVCLLQKDKNKPVALCKYDNGAPLVCKREIAGLVYFIPNINEIESGDCYENLTSSFYPAASVYNERQWINFFILPKISSSSNCRINTNLIVILLILSVLELHNKNYCW